MRLLRLYVNKQINKIKTKGKIYPFLQTKKIENNVKSGKRLPFFLCGSMTVEAAFVLPMFLFALMNLITVIELYRQQSDISAKLYVRAKQQAVYSNEEYIDLVEIYQAAPMAAMMGFGKFNMYNRMRTKAWTGYDSVNATGNDAYSERLVYITPNGTVYHISAACSYLKLSIQAIEKTNIDKLRNADGSIYYECELCYGNEKNMVFITDYGNRYHSTLMCSGLKRIIEAIPISEAGNRRPCQKCGT